MHRQPTFVTSAKRHARPSHRQKDRLAAVLPKSNPDDVAPQSGTVITKGRDPRLDFFVTNVHERVDPTVGAMGRTVIAATEAFKMRPLGQRWFLHDEESHRPSAHRTIRSDHHVSLRCAWSRHAGPLHRASQSGCFFHITTARPWTFPARTIRLQKPSATWMSLWKW